ncbi:hypothetical protein RJG79_05865 [Mycoplasmatota bacterium WC44]
MNKNFDILLILFILGVVLGSILCIVLGVESELMFESNSYIISAKAFISAICLLLVVTKINKNRMYLLSFIFLLGLINGYIFLMLFSVYSFFEIIYRTFLYITLVYFILMFGCTQRKRKDNRIILIMTISAIYGILSYLLY